MRAPVEPAKRQARGELQIFVGLGRVLQVSPDISVLQIAAVADPGIGARSSAVRPARY